MWLNQERRPPAALTTSGLRSADLTPLPAPSTRAAPLSISLLQGFIEQPADPAIWSGPSLRSTHSPLPPPSPASFSLFCKAAIESLTALPFGPGEDATIIANDWHSALVPVLIKDVYQVREGTALGE